MCQCGLHVVLWPHIGISMRFLAAKPRSTARRLFFSQYLCGTILQTLHSMVSDWLLLRAGTMPFYRPKLLALFLSALFSLSRLSFYEMVMCCCMVSACRLIACQLLSPQCRIFRRKLGAIAPGPPCQGGGPAASLQLARVDSHCYIPGTIGT